MTDLNASDRDVNRAIRSWLHQDRHEDVSRVAGAVLDQVETIPQRRATWWPAWRTPIMNKFVTFGLGAAAVVAVLVVGAQFISSPSGGVFGAGPTPTPTLEPTATPEPTLRPPPPLTQSFTSTLHGYSVSYPEGWIAQAATEPWTDDTSVLVGFHSSGDILYDPVLRDHLFLTIASQPIGDSTPEEWVAAGLASEGCTATEPTVVDGAAGLIASDCDAGVAAVTTDGRGYFFHLRRSDEDPSATNAYDRAWFEVVLATVRLHPKDAVD